MINQLKGLLKDASVYGLGEFLNKGVQVLFLPLIFAYIPAKDFGILEYFLTFKNLIAVVLGWGIITAIQRFGSENNGSNLKSVVSSSLIVLIVLDLVVCLILLVGSYYSLSGNLTIENGQLAAILTILTSFFFGIRSVSLGVLRLKRRPQIYMLITLVNVFVYLFGTFILVVFLDSTFMAFLVAGFFGIVISTALGLWFIREELQLSLDIKLVKKIYSFSASVLTTALCFMLLSSTSRLFLSHYGSFLDVATVGMAMKLSLVVGAILVAPFNLAWLPFVNDVHKQDNFKQIVSKVKLLYTIVAGFLIILISLFSKEILLLANDEEYLLASKYVPFYAFTYLLQGMYLIHSSGLYIEKASKKYLAIALSTAIVNILLFIPVLSDLDVLKASIITVLSFLFQFYVTAFFARKTILFNLLNKDLVIVIGLICSILTLSYFDISGFTFFVKVGSIVFFLLIIFTITSAKKDINVVLSVIEGKFKFKR